MIDKTKSPGSPLVFSAANNAGVDKSLLYELVNDRLKALHHLGKEAYKLFFDDDEYGAFKNVLGFGTDRMFNAKMATTLFELNFTDPVLLKIKGEPRKIEKKPRLVCMVSLIVNTVYRLLFNNLLVVENEDLNCPTAVRLDITSTEGKKRIYEHLAKEGMLSSSDVQGWEYAVKPWMHWHAYAGYADRMGLISRDWRTIHRPEFFFTLLGLGITDAHRVIQTENGSLLVGPPCLVSSGKYLTFSANSYMRSLLSEVAAMIASLPPTKFVWSAGDDNLDTNPDLTSYYRVLGIVITDYQAQTPDRYDFCSTVFTKNGGYQENISKFAATFILNPPQSMELFYERLVAFDAYIGHPDHHHYHRILIEVEGLIDWYTREKEIADI